MAGGHTGHMVRGTVWSVLQAVGDRGLIAVLTFVLARMLGPEEIGVAAVATGPAMIVIAALRGFSDVVIRAEDEARSMLNAVFWAALAATVVGAVLAIGVSVLIWGGREDGGRVIEMVGLAAVAGPLAALAVVPEGLLARRFQFRALFLRKMIGALVGAAAAVGVVAAGGRGWSLVVFLVVSQAAGSLSAVVAARWWVSGETAFTSAWRALTFSGRLFLGSLIYQSIPRTLEMACGAVAGLHAAGMVRVALQITEAATNLLHAPVGRMLFSITARIGDDARRIKAALLEVYGVALFAGAAACAAIHGGAPLFVDLVLGAAWSEAAGIIQILCFVLLTYGFDVPARETLKARGEIGRYFLIAVSAGAASVAVILISAPFGLIASAFGYGVAAIVAAAITFVVGRRVLELKAGEVLVPAARQLGVLAVALVAQHLATRSGGVLVDLGVLCLTYPAMTWLLQRRMIGTLRIRMTGGSARQVAT